MKKTILALLTVITAGSQASAIEWIKAEGSCQIESSDKILNLIAIEKPEERFGVVAEAKAEGLEVLVHDVQTHITVYLRGRDLDTQLWVKRGDINPAHKLHFASHSAELQSWVSCKIELKN